MGARQLPTPLSLTRLLLLLERLARHLAFLYTMGQSQSGQSAWEKSLVFPDLDQFKHFFEVFLDHASLSCLEGKATFFYIFFYGSSLSQTEVSKVMYITLLTYIFHPFTLISVNREIMIIV
jgi:hypothetical protein